MFVSADSLDLTKLLANATKQQKNSGDDFTLLNNGNTNNDALTLGSGQAQAATIDNSIAALPLNDFMSYAQLSQSINEGISPGFSHQLSQNIHADAAPGISFTQLSQSINEGVAPSIPYAQLSQSANEETSLSTAADEFNMTANIDIGSVQSKLVDLDAGTGTINSLVSRVFPMSSSANGYLSYMGENTVGTSNSSRNPTSILNTELDNSKSLAAKKLPSELNFKLYLSHLGREFERLIIDQSVSTSTGRLQAFAASASVSNTLFSVPSELVKRHLLITPNSDGLTLWLRDYELNDEHKQNIKNRLINSEYAQQNNINKVCINGELLWEKEEAIADD